MGRKLQTEFFRNEKETTMQCAYSAIATEIEAVRQSFIRSPRRSARRYSVPLGISDRSVGRILYKDLYFHPYKMGVVQELSDRDMANNSMVAERLIGILVDDDR
jgi:hypothetical protein